jgi:hypothetical protein
MFEGDTTAPPPWVPPPLTDEWAAHVSHEFFDQPATFYVANPSTGGDTWDQWQRQ